jgi:hypothetical protein
MGAASKFRPDRTYTPMVLASDPLALTSGAVLPVPQINKLKNPQREPMLVDEIAFKIDDGNTYLGDPWNYFPAARVHVQLKIGNLPLTKSFVPLWLIGTQVTTINGQWPDYYPPDTAAFYTLRLHKPAYLPTGETIDAVFHYSSGFGTNPAPAATVNVTIAYRGRPYVGPPPPVIELPFISHWTVGADLNTGFNPTTPAPAVFRSRGQNLVNATRNWIDVDRMIGRCATNTSSGDFSTSIRMHDNRGNKICRDYTKFGMLFSQANSFTWAMRARLPPGGRLVAEVSQAANALGANGNIYPMLSFLGHRNVTLRDVF